MLAMRLSVLTYVFYACYKSVKVANSWLFVWIASFWELLMFHYQNKSSLTHKAGIRFICMKDHFKILNQTNISHLHVTRDFLVWFYAVKYVLVYSITFTLIWKSVHHMCLDVAQYHLLHVQDMFWPIYTRPCASSLVPSPHPLTRRNGLVNQVEYLGLAGAFPTV